MTTRMNCRTLVTLGLVAALLLTSCSPPTTRAAEVAESKLDRVSSPDVSATDIEQLVRGNNAFAWELYQAWRDDGGNLFYSPYSISVALAMTYAGARGETEQQMRETLNFLLSNERLHPAFNSLDQELNSLAESGREHEKEPFQLNIANSIWGQSGYKWLPEFLDLLAENYGAGLRLTDFVKNPEAARQAINNWVSEKTNDRIEDLIAKGLIDPTTRLVLANAIYFKAAWQHQFDESRTEDTTFYLVDGKEVTVPMMAMATTGQLLYASGDGYQAVELPYQGGRVAMTIVVPDAGRYRQFEDDLSAERMEAIVGGLEYQAVAVRLPKFEYESNCRMAQTLAEMGMPDAFREQADLSGMDGTKDLFISEVVHKAFVAVDEVGTEAAAATAVMIALAAMPTTPVQLTIDRPFVFAIRDVKTGSTLFVGRVLDPTS